MGNKIALLYELEEKLVKSLKERRSVDGINKEIVNLITPNIDEYIDRKKGVFRSVEAFLSNIKFSHIDMQELYRLAKSENSIHVDYLDLEFNEIKGFIEHESNIDLKNVSCYYIDYETNAKSGGFAQSCKTDQHCLFFQSYKYSQLVKSLIAHELGHAVDFVVSRRVDAPILSKNHVVMESIASYFEYKYLLEYGSVGERAMRMLTFIETFTAIQIVKYCRKKHIELNEIDVKNAVHDSLFDDLIITCGREFIESHMGRIVNEFDNLYNIFNELLCHNFGLILGLYLLDFELDKVMELSESNDVNIDMDQYIVFIIPQIIENYETIFNGFGNKLVSFVHGKPSYG